MTFRSSWAPTSGSSGRSPATERCSSASTSSTSCRSTTPALPRRHQGVGRRAIRRLLLPRVGFRGKLRYFEQRGLPVRDVFDTAFDTVLHVSPLTFAGARSSANGWSTSQSPTPVSATRSPAAPHDLMRITRQLFGVRSATGQTQLRDLATQLAEARLAERLHAFEGEIAGWNDIDVLATLDWAENVRIGDVTTFSPVAPREHQGAAAGPGLPSQCPARRGAARRGCGARCQPRAAVMAAGAAEVAVEVVDVGGRQLADREVAEVREQMAAQHRAGLGDGRRRPLR